MDDTRDHQFDHEHKIHYDSLCIRKRIKTTLSVHEKLEKQLVDLILKFNKMVGEPL